MCERSAEKYERTRRALLALAARTRKLLRRAYEIRDDIKYEMYMAKKRRNRRLALRLEFFELDRINRVINTIREKRKYVNDLLDDLATFSPGETVCYGEFWTRIESIGRTLDGLEGFLEEFKAKIKRGVLA